MPKIDVNKWLKDQQSSMGISDAELAIAAKVFAAPGFDQTFIDQNTFKSELDKNVNPLRQELAKVNDYNARWQQATEHLGRKYNAVAELRELGFDVDDLQNDGRGGIRNSSGEGLTASEVQSMIAKAVQDAVSGVDSRVDKVRQGLVDISFFIPGAMTQYQATYGKTFDASGFRKFAAENAGKYPDLNLAYDIFTAPDKEAKEKTDREKWEKDKESEITQRVMAQHMSPELGTPADGGGAFFRASNAPEKDDKGNAAAPPAHSYSMSDANPTSSNVNTVARFNTPADQAVRLRIADKYKDADFSTSKTG